MKELRIKAVFTLIEESRTYVSELRSSVGPVTSESLEKIETFLMDLEKEVVPALPKKRLISLSGIVLALGFLLAIDRLLQELVPGAITVVVQLLLK